METGGAEKRESTRIPCIIECLIDTGENTNKYYSLNISVGGMFVITDIIVPLGSIISFELISDDESVIFKGKGIVMWTSYIKQTLKSNLKTGFGIKFINIEKAGNYSFQDYLDDLLKGVKNA